MNPVPQSNVHAAVARCRRLSGQGMTEYLIVVALIAVAAIGVYSLLGQTLRSQTAGLAMEVSGQDAGAAIGASQGQAAAAQSSAATRKGLSNYNEANR
ncbi:MAG: Flp family type IVb pilin [Burkholderiales bacterium]|jgi:type IV pilus assembly protein PilA